jgi:hypothetical protein
LFCPFRFGGICETNAEREKFNCQVADREVRVLKEREEGQVREKGSKNRL